MYKREIFKLTTAKENIILWLALSVVFLLRFYFSQGVSLWNDELAVTQPLFTFSVFDFKSISAHATGQMQPALPYILLRWYLFLIKGHSLPMFLPSILASIGTVFFVFLILRKLLSFNYSLLGLVVFAFSPVQYVYSMELRHYALVSFFAAGFFYYSLNIYNGYNNRRNWVFLLFFGSMMSYFYYFALFLLSMVLVCLFLRSNKKYKYYVVSIYLFVLLTEFLFFKNGLLTILRKKPVYISDIANLSFDPFAYFGAVFTNFWPYAAQSDLIIFSLFLFSVFVFIWKKFPKIFLWALAAMLIFVAAYLKNTDYALNPRYAICFEPIVFIMIFISISYFLNSFRKSYVVILSILFMILSLWTLPKLIKQEFQTLEKSPFLYFIDKIKNTPDSIILDSRSFTYWKVFEHFSLLDKNLTVDIEDLTIVPNALSAKKWFIFATNVAGECPLESTQNIILHQYLLMRNPNFQKSDDLFFRNISYEKILEIDVTNLKAVQVEIQKYEKCFSHLGDPSFYKKLLAFLGRY